MKLKSSMKMLLVVMLGLFATGAYASTGGGATGAEWLPLYTMLFDTITGYGGRAIAFAFLIGGVLFGVAKQSPMLAIGGVIAAIFLFYLPTIINNIFTAVI